MARGTERLQFAEPERLLIAFVWHDMIGNDSRFDYTMAQAEGAQGFKLKLQPGFAPPTRPVIPLDTFAHDHTLIQKKWAAHGG
jgi:hypothetical protein